MAPLSSDRGHLSAERSPLSPERWQALEQLFIAAADLAPGDREAFVARETADDPELQHHLRGMLAHASGVGERLAHAIDTAARSMVPHDWVGRRIGAWRIVREIGRGGMGLVFEAVRDDDEYHKRVALKVAPWSHDVALLRQRFRLERQILAELEHPHIAQFLDGGTDDDLPYFVMEYVEGSPITKYCDGRRLDSRARIELVRQVCGAVHFAHERLVVHRDLKPANILVRDDGTPKLLDFGIAKLVDRPVDTDATVESARMWTPDYTSPEQVRGRAITTRTDVYSLGLILYELLTGVRAQVADVSTLLALDRSICETEPARPSDAARARGDRVLARRLRGDLDTIVMTAIAKDPEQRYRSVAAFSEDLGRYLDGLPVQARPATWAYGARKFLRRHRASAIAAALVVAAAGVGLATTWREARRAERRFQQVRTLVNTFMFDVHDRIESLPGATDARRTIVQTALVYLENLRADASDDPGLSRELATAYQKIGHVQGNPLRSNLGDIQGAIASYTRAAEILGPLADRGDVAAQRAAAALSYDLAIVRRAHGDVPGAMAAFTRARDLVEQLIAATPDDRRLLALASTVHAHIARATYELRDYGSAERGSQRAMQLARRLIEMEPGNREHRNVLSDAHSALGQTSLSTGQLEQAADNFRASIALREQLVREDPSHTEYRRTLLVGYGHLGDVLGFRPGLNLGDVAGAIAAYLKAVELAAWAADRDPADRRATFDLANAKYRLGSVLIDAGQASAALRHIEEAERLTARLVQQNPASERYGYLLAAIDKRLGDTQALMGRTNAAIHHLEKARSAAAGFLSGPSGPNARLLMTLATVNLARLRARSGDRRAVALADSVAAEIARSPLSPPAIQASVKADLDRVYRAMRTHAAARGKADSQTSEAANDLPR